VGNDTLSVTHPGERARDEDSSKTVMPDVVFRVMAFVAASVLFVIAVAGWRRR
jgi:hypothetical protein